jgi:hypothetical protein
MTRGRRALFALAGYGVLLGAILFVMAPFTIGFRLPIYGGEHIRWERAGAVWVSLGVFFAAFGAWGIARGAPRNGFAAILIGCAAPLLVMGSPFALVLSVPTLVGGVYCGMLLTHDRSTR